MTARLLGSCSLSRKGLHDSGRSENRILAPAAVLTLETPEGRSRESWRAGNSELAGRSTSCWTHPETHSSLHRSLCTPLPQRGRREAIAIMRWSEVPTPCRVLWQPQSFCFPFPVPFTICSICLSLLSAHIGTYYWLFTCLFIWELYMYDGSDVEVSKQLQRIGSLLPWHGQQGGTQILRLGGECLYPLSHPAGPCDIF